MTALIQARSSNLIGETNSWSVMLASADLRVQQANKMTRQTVESRQVAKMRISFEIAVALLSREYKSEKPLYT